MTVRSGQQRQRTVSLTNSGSAALAWRIRDGAGSTGRRTPGQVLKSWPADGLAISRGIGVESGNVWVSDADLLRNDSFTPDGVRREEGWPTPWANEYPGPADMAYVPARAVMCQVKIGADNGVYCWNPRSGEIVASIVGQFPWSTVSQSGLAYRPDDDSFYIGGGNQGIIYHIAGLGHPVPGRVISQCAPADPAIAGLGWNPGFGLLWVATNSAEDLIHAVDPHTCVTLTTLTPPDQVPFSGAGLDVDVDGNLWLMSAGSPGTAYLVDSGVPSSSDAPWLSVTPASGLLAPGGTQRLTVRVDATALAPGRYRATLYLLSNNESRPVTTVPVRVTVRSTGPDRPLAAA
ncbi:hypothetical protein K1W54_12000 [Micromonospora sp. CPCC 205371]|nr:hypothetical protein [Micromonospora sp. CPCC 205371]